LFLCSSLWPIISPQKPSADLWACFDSALAPTVNLGGLELPSSCSTVRVVCLRLKLSKTDPSWTGQTSFDPTVLRIPSQVRNPLGVKEMRKFLISMNKLWLSSFWRDSNTSSTVGVSLERVSRIQHYWTSKNGLPIAPNEYHPGWTREYFWTWLEIHNLGSTRPI
jgi:hypothetical protein